MSDFKPRPNRCKNCAARYIQTREKHYFCSDRCRVQFNRYGISLAKVQELVEREIRKRIPEIERRLVDKFTAVLRRRNKPVPEELTAIKQNAAAS